MSRFFITVVLVSFATAGCSETSGQPETGSGDSTKSAASANAQPGNQPESETGNHGSGGFGGGRFGGHSGFGGGGGNRPERPQRPEYDDGV